MLDNILFVHDHKFYRDVKGNYYSEGKLALSAFDRFLSISKSVSVLCRKMPEVLEANMDGLSLASSDSVKYFPVSGISWKEILGLRFIGNIKSAFHLVRNADLVVIRVPCIFSLIIFPLLFLLRKKYAVEVVGDAREAIRGDGKRKHYVLLAFLYDLYTKLVVRLSDGAIYVTQYSLQKKYPSPFITGYASNVSIAEVDSEVLFSRKRKIRGMKKQEKYKIGIIGSFNNNYKGIDTLIEAVSKVRDTLNVELYIVGTGDKKQFEEVLRKCQASGWVYFEGRLSKDDINKWLDHIDLYCQPSRTEGLPRALIEAMSRGCPALATNVGGIPELLIDDFLVPAGSPLALAKKISFLLENESLMLSCASENFSKAREYYDVVLSERRTRFWKNLECKVIGA